MKFKVRVLDKGRKRTELIEALNASDAKRKLHQQGLRLISLQREFELGLGRGPWSLKKRLEFFDNLGPLLESGLQLQEALEAMQQFGNKAEINKLSEALKQGRRFSEALTQEDCLPVTDLALIQLAEESGEIVRIVNELRQRLKSAYEWRSKIMTLLIYPIMLSVIATAVFSFVLIWGFPRLEGTFEIMNVSLPPLSQMVLDLGLRASVFAPYLLIVMFVTFIIVFRAFRLNQPWLVRLMSIIPVFRSIQFIAFLSPWERLLSRGLAPQTILESLKTIFKSSETYKNELLLIEKKIKEGQSLAGALVDIRWCEERDKGLLKLAERSGQFSKQLGRVLEQKRLLLEESLRRLVVLLEPVLILAIGVVVMLFVLLFVLPMMTLPLQGL